MLKQQLIEKAASLGFAQVRVMAPERLAKWEAVALALGLDLSGRAVDPRETMPECRSVIQLIYPYRPFELDPPVAAPSAYYLASNASAQAARDLAAWLAAQGHRATSASALPEKALAERCGGGRYGRNGVIGVGEWGSRIALRAILTDAEIEPDALYDGDGFAEACGDCAACVSACPTGALDGTGHVDRARCLRAQADQLPFPEAWRQLLGGSFLGCDLCQDACPRNARVERVAVPDAVLRAFALEKILAGDLDGVAELIGANYARKKRLQARACIVAANLGRRDCLDAVRGLSEDESELVRDAASWAEGRLMGRAVEEKGG